MKRVLVLLVMILVSIHMAYADDDDWIDGIKIRSGHSDTAFKVYITSDYKQIIRSDYSGGRSQGRKQLSQIVLTLPETIWSGPKGGKPIFFRGGYLDYAMKSEQKDLVPYPEPGSSITAARQYPKIRTEIYNNFFSPTERTFADSNSNWALSADVESSHFFFGYYFGLFAPLFEDSRMFKLGVGIGVLFLDLNLKLNLCSKFVDGKCEGKTNIDYVSNDYIAPSLIYTVTVWEIVTDDSIWKFFSTEFSEMEGEAPKIKLKLTNRSEKLYLTVNTINVEFISYTYRF